MPKRYGTYVCYQTGWDKSRAFDGLEEAKRHAEGLLGDDMTGDLYEVQVVDEQTGQTVFSLVA